MKLRRGRGEAGSPTAKGVWLTTFNDMMTLLMVFFVLLFSMSTVDMKRFKHFQGELQSALGILEAGQRTKIGVVDPEPPMARTSEESGDAPLPPEVAAQVKELRQLSERLGLPGIWSPRRIQITLEDALLFGSAQTRFSPKAMPVLTEVAAALKKIDGDILVEGHTDNRPIVSDRYPSNWALSTARAAQVVKFLIDAGQIAPQRLAAVGYAASKPIASNDTPEGRATNRRVEIVLLMKPS
ncbi:MAG: OmpA family protein [Desulfosarcinaceae bacterium]|jgi:chemotaxis protein MotB